MKKNYVRLLALLICAVMVLGMVPTNASALTLEKKQMPKHNAIEYDAEWGDHYFTEFADVVEIAMAAAADPDNYYYAVCENEAGMTLSSNLTIPYNMVVVFDGDVVIPAGVYIDLFGQLYCNNLTVLGTVTIGHFSDDDNYDNDKWGYLNPWGNVYIEGLVYVSFGTFCFNIDSTVIGEGNIHIADNGNGYIEVDAYIQTESDLVEAVNIATSDITHKQYSIYVQTNNLHITNPVTIPQNARLSLSYPVSVISGAPITVCGNINFGAYQGNILVKNDLIIEDGADCYFSGMDTNKTITMEGNITNNSSISVHIPVVIKGVLDNHSYVHLQYENNGRLNFASADLYRDHKDEGSFIHLYHNATYFPDDAITGLNLDAFQIFVNDPQDWSNMWRLSDYQYGGSSEPPVHTHTPVTDPAVTPTCLTYGATEGAHCGECGEILLKQEVLAPLGHDYGLDQNGDPDFRDPDCDVCGAVRVINPERLTHSMYRMYNPNSGEHFYTGSMEERKVLEAAGWKYEGVGFTFPASAGDPVYRLFQPSTGEHLYTMNEDEKAALLAAGWTYEGIAFNSDFEQEVPQYRLYNPNVTVGAYHFTASAEERDVLLNAGWIDQGIGFYTCLQ